MTKTLIDKESTMMAKVVYLAVISLFISYSSSSANKETEETLKSTKNLNVGMVMEEKARTSNDMDRRRETEGNLTRIFSSTPIPKFVLGDLSDIGVFEVKPNPEVTMVLFIFPLILDPDCSFLPPSPSLSSLLSPY